MLLETLDVLKNDIIIYSENKFDFKENFKIIFKRAEIKRPQNIDYFEVCKFIMDPTPKNIIAYRLLTSLTDLDAYATKFGYFINTKTKLELIYFDPIFALKDLTHFKISGNPQDFRFKIQQVGFSTVDNRNNENVYEEVYSFDLRAIESQNQNDKIYAQAIFALDESFIDENDNNVRYTTRDDLIEEDEKKFTREMRKAAAPKNNSNEAINEDNINKLKKSFASGWNSEFNAYNEFKMKSTPKEKKQTSSFSAFIDKHREKDIFKEGIFQSNNDLLSAGREEVILRFKS